MNHAKTDTGGHKEGKKEGKPETVRMPQNNFVNMLIYYFCCCICVILVFRGLSNTFMAVNEGMNSHFGPWAVNPL